MFLGGSINLLKPAGMTSHDAVYFFRKQSGIKRVGHGGTLDPMATGVLPLLVGNATRIMEYLDIDDKGYRCEMVLGLETETQDIWGKIIEDRRSKIKNIREQNILEEFKNYLGKIYQKPPSVSAVRVDGKRLYEYKREGEHVNVKPRPVIVKSLEVLTIDLNRGRIVFDILCSKGTYIRSICHDVGKALGCGGAMSFLSRSKNGAYELKDAVTLDELKDDWKSHILDLDFPLRKFGKIDIKADRLKWFINGGYLRPSDVKISATPSYVGDNFLPIKKNGLDRAFNVYCEGVFLGVVLFNEEEKIYVTDKVFYK